MLGAGINAIASMSLHAQIVHRGRKWGERLIVPKNLDKEGIGSVIELELRHLHKFREKQSRSESCAVLHEGERNEMERDRVQGSRREPRLRDLNETINTMAALGSDG
jgi:hypothetical protein